MPTERSNRARVAARGSDPEKHLFLEFFAGGGMARAGLGPKWDCIFANDVSPKKARVYSANWGAEHLHVGDVAEVTPKHIPGVASLAWASFPCQDLSLAGAGAGLRGDRSGTFWPFWKLMRGLRSQRRAPAVVVLENVYGSLTSHDGKDFVAICEAVAGTGYRFGALIVDAVHFLPQSRPRLFVVAVRDDIQPPSELVSAGPVPTWHPAALNAAHQKLSSRARAKWNWWQLPPPPPRKISFSDLVEREPVGIRWHTSAETKKLIQMMSATNVEKLRDAQRRGTCQVGTVYRRTRVDKDGVKRQRAEIRFDDVAGCLRTPAGGSSRQTIVVVEGKKVRSRLLAPREAARLMGLADSYALPTNYNEAYHLAGDGVAVPVVRFLATHLFEPILRAQRARRRRVA